jgi:hypothetical protein
MKMNCILKMIEDGTADKITSGIQQIARYPHHRSMYSLFMRLPLITGIGAMRIKDIHPKLIMDIMSEP